MDAPPPVLEDDGATEPPPAPVVGAGVVGTTSAPPAVAATGDEDASAPPGVFDVPAGVDEVVDDVVDEVVDDAGAFAVDLVVAGIAWAACIAESIMMTGGCAAADAGASPVLAVQATVMNGSRYLTHSCGKRVGRMSPSGEAFALSQRGV
ncbi:MAG: hypothetical protein ABJE47_21145 [bacterium]